jgi:predicted secreted protein
MSNTNARAAFPSIIAFSSVGSTGTFVTCAGITKITPPKYTRGFVDVTDMNSTDYYEDSALAGPIRTGTMGYEANYLSTDTQQKTLIREAFENGTRIGWKITLAGTSSGNIWYGDAIVSAYSLGELTQEGKVSMTFEMKTKGKPTGPVDSTT